MNGDFKCFKCGKIGHKASVYTNKRQVQTKEKHKNADTSFAAFLSENETADSFMADFNANNNNNNCVWILDGCTAHLCGDQNSFICVENMTNVKLNLASHACAEVKGKGCVKISVKCAGGSRTIQIKYVLYVPDLRSNLISISKITDKGYTVKFYKDFANVYNEAGDVILTAERRGDFYYVQQQDQCAAAQVHNSHIMTWHYRLGHLNANDMNKLIKGKILPNVGALDINEISQCDVCVKGKMAALPFNKNHMACTETLQVIHSDMCCPFRIESLQREKYFVTFIDECSKWSKVYFFARKVSCFRCI